MKKVLTFAGAYNIIYLASGKKRINTTITKAISGCGSAWLERLVWDQEAAGSNPVTPTVVSTMTTR